MENLDLFTREMDYPREAAVSLSQSLEQFLKVRRRSPYSQTLI